MQSKTATELFAEFDKAIKECFTVPNHWLPEEFQDQRSDCVSLADIETKCDRRDKITEAKRVQAEKDKRIETYRRQIERGERIAYIPK